MPQADGRIYLDLALSQVPRILSLQDRNPFSATYGSFHRSHWLHRTVDFPSSIAQLGVHTLALLWAKPIPDNIYCGSDKLLQWCVAGIRYWMSLQKSDGSFDEWYPNERGWAGPTGYLLHAMLRSYWLLGDAFPKNLKDDFFKATRLSAMYLLNYEEDFVLANHHAIALLPIYEAYVLLQEPQIRHGFNRSFEVFLKYCDKEGWSLEYDGADIGYQAGTISFLARLHQHLPSEHIEAWVGSFVDFTSYHLYPNGTYGGCMGSRQTMHFYPFGYEYFASSFPMAAAMANKARTFYKRGLLVPPGTQEDHYVLYRLPEFIDAYLIHKDLPKSLPLLPYEQPSFEKWFQRAGIYIRKEGSSYAVANLRRGGVIKAYDISSAQEILQDCGWIGELDDGSVVTSQWNGRDYQVEASGRLLSSEGLAHQIDSRSFTPVTMIGFRLFMLFFGWNAFLAKQIKAGIRRLLTVGHRPGEVRFERSIHWSNEQIVVKDIITLLGKKSFCKLYVGDEIFHRYVPQSRYFQPFELNVAGYVCSKQQLQQLKQQKTLILERAYVWHSRHSELPFLPTSSTRDEKHVAMDAAPGS